MKKQIGRTLAGIALLGAVFPALAVQPNVYNVVFSGVNHVPGSGPMSSVDYLIPAEPIGFTADFSESRTLTFNFLAPEGQEFSFNASAPTFMTAVFRTGQGQQTWGSVISAGFLGDNGQAPTDLESSFATTPNGATFGIQAFASTSFSFSGIWATVEAPEGDSDRFVNVTPEVLTFKFEPVFGDVGQQVTLQSSSVPEPSTMAFVGLAGLSLRLFRRRK